MNKSAKICVNCEIYYTNNYIFCEKCGMFLLTLNEYEEIINHE